MLKFLLNDIHCWVAKRFHRAFYSSLNIDTTRLIVRGGRGKGDIQQNRMYAEANVEVVCPGLNISQGYISVIQGTNTPII